MVPIKEFTQPKISIILNLNDVTEKYFEKCFDSICNQELDYVEIICVENENYKFDKFQKYLLEYEFIKIFDEYYLQNNFNLIINSDYILFLNAKDWLLFVGLKHAYNLAIENDMDILINSYNIFHEFSGEIEDPYQEEYAQLNNLNSFSGNDFKNILFNMPKYSFNLYKTDFIKKLNLKIPLDLTSQISFFINSSMMTSRIGYNNKPLLYNRLNEEIDNLNYYNLICNDFNFGICENNLEINMDSIIDTYFNILYFLEKEGIYNCNKYYLWNYIFRVFRRIYLQNFKNNIVIFKNIHDFCTNVFSKYHNDLVLNLKIENLTFYRSILKSNSIYELELLYENNRLVLQNEGKDKIINEKNNLISNLNNDLANSSKKLDVEIKKYLNILDDKDNRINILEEKYSYQVHENNLLIAKLSEVETSRSWRLTKIFRKIGMFKSIIVLVTVGFIIFLVMYILIIMLMLIIK
ncbi:glycosyltransferase family 2 protein [Methanobrevibacter sp. A27]|uniref:glycosyltransferase family 2 protein n=1 Tax=Methanobrevibacter sp. A27 TaxID=1860099 RepID=UPI00084C40FB|nr:glycosyltransferase family 2 protein [Methanobrevibacter sp. A27]OEC94253.1 hypothetical protein A9505_08980 [Methanobrevibacter sp. A27]